MITGQCECRSVKYQLDGEINDQSPQYETEPEED